MAIKRHEPEEIVAKLRPVEVLVGQGMASIDAIHEISITEQTYYRWRKRYGGMGKDGSDYRVGSFNLMDSRNHSSP
jgi:transposase